MWAGGLLGLSSNVQSAARPPPQSPCLWEKGRATATEAFIPQFEMVPKRAWLLEGGSGRSTVPSTPRGSLRPQAGPALCPVQASLGSHRGTTGQLACLFTRAAPGTPAGFRLSERILVCRAERLQPAECSVENPSRQVCWWHLVSAWGVFQTQRDVSGLGQARARAPGEGTAAWHQAPWGHLPLLLPITVPPGPRCSTSPGCAPRQQVRRPLLSSLSKSF